MSIITHRLIVPEFMEQVSVMMIGLGHSSQQIMLNLTKAGVKYWYVMDEDRVEDHNLGTLFADRHKAYSRHGQYKTEVASNLIDSYTPFSSGTDMNIMRIRRMFQESTDPPIANFYFSTVDNGDARITIFERLLEKVVDKMIEPLQWLVDVRVDFDYYEITAINLHDESAVKQYRRMAVNWIGRAPEVVCDQRNYIGTVSMIGAAVLTLLNQIINLHFKSMVMIKGNSQVRREDWVPELPKNKIAPRGVVEEGEE